MSNEVFPVLSGLSFGTERKYAFETEVQKNVSGREVRQAMRAYPIRSWLLRYEFLRQNLSRTEFSTLLGFFLRHKGRFDTFLFEDIADKTVTDAPIGTGNGSRTAWQLVRPLGGFAEPIYSPNTMTQVKVNGTPTTAYTVNAATGVITFTSAPANTHAILASFTYYWRVRFDDDVANFREFVRSFYENQRLALQYVPT
jgi:uncharacterized protein (TIGR02217 family)